MLTRHIVGGDRSRAGSQEEPVGATVLAVVDAKVADAGRVAAAAGVVVKAVAAGSE